ncbi:MAG: ribulokinase [Planctomycetota bacterium]
MSSTPRYSLGLDYGTGSVRALVVDIADGREVASSVVPYPHGEDGIVSSERDPHVARQHPTDYSESLERAVTEAMSSARRDAEFARAESSGVAIIGIGVDATASTPIPVDANVRPLVEHEQFQNDESALAWLWKDHSAHEEADEITSALKSSKPEQLERSGGACSSEWLIPKLLRCLRVAPELVAAADDWIELGDYVVAFLGGIETCAEIPRNACAAGHKGLYHETLGGPPLDVLASISPELSSWLETRLPKSVVPAGTCAANLGAEWARRLGLPEGIPISAAAIDAHVGAVGAGIRPRTLVKILGTSSCDMLVHPHSASEALGEIPGLNGSVLGSILPGHWGLEAGQAAFGDLYAWFVREFERDHGTLTDEASALVPGASGLLSLDWNNGNRCLLGDPLLSGLLVGQTLRTTPAEVYRALIEATAFGGRMIVDRLAEHGIPVDDILCCGGIAGKNDLLLQIHADVLGRPLRRTLSEQTVAVGAAMFGAVAAGEAGGGYSDIASAQAAMAPPCSEERFEPNADSARTYAELCALYSDLHDAFGGVGEPKPLAHVMKRLLEIQARARS